MEHNLTLARNKIYKTKWALKKAFLSPKFFYSKWKGFLENFYIETERNQSPIKTVHLSDLISKKIELRLSDFAQRDGNVSMDEILAISALVRSYAPKILLELGTFDGNTALQMALNAPDQAVVHTLDLPSAPMRTKEPISKADLRYVLDEQKKHRKYLGTSVESKVVQHFGDSTNFDFNIFTEKGPVDFVFIDAGHTYECVKSDTRNALQILSPKGVILWHDYHPFWNGVYTFLNELAQDLPIVRIAGTNLACYRRSCEE